MEEWTQVSTLAELEDFLRTVGYFHDGIIKEVHWVNRDFVDQELTMHPANLAGLRMLVQRQWENPSAVELVFEDVWRTRLDTVHFVCTSNAETQMSTRMFGEPRPLLRLSIEESEVVFERMRWRDASEWMGPSQRLLDVQGQP